jgi:hypothetical protein
MIRYGAIILLFLSIFLMIREISETWNDSTIPTSGAHAQQPDPASEGTDRDLVFNPAVPQNLPDFKNGYLFNEQRSLRDETEPAQGVAEDNLDKNDLGIQTNINDATFTGAIITDSLKKAILTYRPTSEPIAQQRGGPRAPLRRTIPNKSQGGLETTQLKEGDLISGYKVSSIEPDKIVFTKGEEVIEKHLYDSGKTRIHPAARGTQGNQQPQRPRPDADGESSASGTSGAPTSTRTAQIPPRQINASPRQRPARRLVVSRSVTVGGRSGDENRTESPLDNAEFPQYGAPEDDSAPETINPEENSNTSRSIRGRSSFE